MSQSIEQGNTEPAINETTMAGEKPTLRLIGIKVLASSCMTKVEAINQMKDSWDADNDIELKLRVIDIALLCEYTTKAFDEIVTLTDQLLRGPPPYEQGPDQRRHRLMELQVLVFQVRDYAGQLSHHVNCLEELAIDGEEMRLLEASSRAEKVVREAGELRERG